MIRKRATVRGRVQGVCFRAATRDHANSLGLVGWVQNQADGSVSLEAEGPGADVEALLTWCHEGPRHAEVRSLEESEITTLGSESSFLVRSR